MAFQLTITYHTGAQEEHIVELSDRDQWPTAWLKAMAQEAETNDEPLEATIHIGLVCYEIRSIVALEVGLPIPLSARLLGCEVER